MSTNPIRRAKPSRRTIVVVLFVIIVAVVLYIVWSWVSAARFESIYTRYAAAQTEYVVAANKPAAESNPVRREVYLLLAQVLQVEMTDDSRIEKAKQGIAHLNDMEAQIDAIKDEADTVAPLLAEMERVSGNSVHSEMKALVVLGKRQVEIISDIRGLSYRADFYTDEVFERIIDDQGQMTDEHKRYLNDLIPQLEEQFDKRTNLYTELMHNDEKMKQLAEDLGYATIQ